MESPELLRKVDNILLPLLQMDELEFRPALDKVITLHAEPVMREIIRYRMRVSMNSESPKRDIEKDAEDIHGEVVVRVLTRLQNFRISPAERAIHDFRNYVAVVTHNTCNEYFREKYPERSRLKNRLRYLLRHHPGFAIWESTDQEWLCGFTKWQARKTPVRTERFHQLQNNPASWKRAEDFKGKLAEFANAIFLYLETPLLLEDLVNITAIILGVKEKITQSDGILLDRLPDLYNEQELDQRSYLTQLWLEIRQLPLKQRKALLLNLRDEKGANIIHLFPRTGVAGIRQIADVLEIPLNDFANLWRELPIEDAKIAILLSATRQQVINLRKCARERLARRMREFEETDV